MREKLKTEVSTVRHTDLQGESLSRKQLSADVKWVSAAFLNDLLYERILYKGAIYISRKTLISFLFVSGQQKIANMRTLSKVVSAERIAS